VSRIPRQRPVPATGQCEHLLESLSQCHPISHIAPPPSHLGTGRGAKGNTPCYRRPSIPASQVSPNLQPDCNRSQTCHQANCAPRLQRTPRFTNGFAPLGAPVVHKLPTIIFSVRARIGARSCLADRTEGGELHQCNFVQPCLRCVFDYGVRSCCRGRDRARGDRVDPRRAHNARTTKWRDPRARRSARSRPPRPSIAGDHTAAG
jgi:hypothetical protein